MTKILATFVGGKLTKMKDLPCNDELLGHEHLEYYRANQLITEINEVEKRVHLLVKDNFEDLRDFIYKNI